MNRRLNILSAAVATLLAVIFLTGCSTAKKGAVKQQTGEIPTDIALHRRNAMPDYARAMPTGRM